jgi:5-methylcytosine-specific restriction protein B
MASPDLQQLWTDFLTAWPAGRVREMTLDQYTNLDKNDAFVYWLEKRTEALGSVWGGSAFKWGVYRRNDKAKREDGRGIKWTDTYAWYTRYGDTAEQAFQTIRGRLVEVIDAAQQGELERIEDIDVCWPIVKWKVAFLYQDRQAPRTFPLYHEDRLFQRYRVIAPSARQAESRRAVMYPALIKHYAPVGDVFDICRTLIEQEAAAPTNGPRFWAVPLQGSLSSTEALALCAQSEVNPQDVPSLLDAQLVAAKVASGDQLALLVGSEVRAVGEVEVAEAGGFVWSQRAVAVSPDMIIPATVVEIDAETRDQIWEGGLPEASAEASCWLLRVGGEAPALWESWSQQGYASLPWSEVGDLSNCMREDFDNRVADLRGTQKHKEGYEQELWTFRNLPVGARLIAWRRPGTRVVGVGTVIGPYEFHGEADEGCHWIRVRWDALVDSETFHFKGGSMLSKLPLDAFLRLVDSASSGGQTDGFTLDTMNTDSSTPSQDSHSLDRRPATPIPDPQAVILYGPPGTGKTWTTIERALQIILGADEVARMSDAERGLRFRGLLEGRRIEFVTFHQSYGYEEFVEGIRPVLDESAGGNVRYTVHHGAFKEIALRAAAEGLRVGTSPDSFSTLWQRLLDEVGKEGERVVQASQGKSYLLRQTSQGNLETVPCDVDAEGSITPREGRQVASRDSVKLVWDHRFKLGVEPSALTYEKTRKVFAAERGGDGGHHYTAIRLVYTALLEMSRSVRTRAPTTPSTNGVQEALDRSQAGTVDFQFDARTPPYVLIIDEINRGNISKILGELITLLEPDKRLGAPNELKLPLAYSPKHRFAVPPNLHIIGTMNTADRSIALMDVALRRRFRFEEMLPDAGVLRARLREKAVSAALVDLIVDLFETLNERIRFLYDRDHQIGHAYLLKVRTLEDLREVFADRIIPLLQEYFYGAWDKVGMVLGCPHDDEGRPRRDGPSVEEAGKNRRYRAPMIVAAQHDVKRVLGFNPDDLEGRIDLEIAPAFRPRPAGAAPARTNLASAFLGVLNLTPEEWKARAAALTGEQGP